MKKVFRRVVVNLRNLVAIPLILFYLVILLFSGSIAYGFKKDIWIPIFRKIGDSFDEQYKNEQIWINQA